jgi:rhodanese-related sulfurtransferase
MEILTRKEVIERGLPEHAHIVELVDSFSECETHRHFEGIECVPIQNLSSVADRYRPNEPIVVHCERPGRCEQAAEQLARMGFSEIFRFEGNIWDLEGVSRRGWVSAGGTAATWTEAPAPILSRSELEALLDKRGDKVKLFDLVADEQDCPAFKLGVKCLEPRLLKEQGLMDVNRDRTIVLRCQEGIDCQDIAREVRSEGFQDVCIFKGRFEDVSWTKRT